ncbi:FAD dependent oxidoreductase [Salpingoeca rosetta]|uniref:FAD dependent oxidoreductase n=1 Tax=Salpingoeca rosetta (strain ATCC 50818 / BSB-021) TaxID=946362 RepID=F2UFW5_SALR5|nr:FAD dependent oxidoreductase [Salpingoeca rosetta]EGD75393.1 FAD dependent oxidoreductase [Salpingoeca rosetta]|eukprot:XP_004991850.1 FAD dependent oxidoreductase [Salpingoeca rosetta]
MRALRPVSRAYDAIIVGGGHNGLVAAAYLARQGGKVLVLEKNDQVGGAAVSSEIVPGFKFSRASYLAGLIRPSIVKELDLHKHGLRFLPRDPSSFTPTKTPGQHLMFWDDETKTAASIAQFSKHDADAFPKYEAKIGRFRDLIQPFLERPLPNVSFDELQRGNLMAFARLASQHFDLLTHIFKYKKELAEFYELLTAPASQILDRWFESEMLKTTLATDAVIGSMAAPSDPGSAYVLLHHVMGEVAGRKGVWAYVEGGMGALSNAIAASAKQAGAEIIVNADVQEILIDESSNTNGGKKKGRRGDDASIDAGGVTGVRVVLGDGTEMEVSSNFVLSNCTPHRTYTELLPKDRQASLLGEDFLKRIQTTDYSCGAFKINCAVSELPDFVCAPNKGTGPEPHHHGTIHFENSMHELERAAAEAKTGRPATRPVIEMTIPSAIDKTIAPEGKHVVQLFVQYAPYDVDPQVGTWADESFKESFVRRVFSVVDEFAPNFSSSVIGYDALSPLDIEREFGLHKGNIFHGAMSLHQILYLRPTPEYCDGTTPIDGLYICGSGVHPGGGVMGAPGRNAARIVLQDAE